MVASPVSVLLVEDEPLWQTGIAHLLALDGDFTLVATAATEVEALAAYQDHQPNIVLLDWKLADGDDGLVVGKQLEEAGHPSSHMVVVSGSDPEIIPKNPYSFVPKPYIASRLLPTLRAIIESAG